MLDLGEYIPRKGYQADSVPSQTCEGVEEQLDSRLRVCAN